ncbi:MAG TPA: hypothetical protein VGR00_00120, partial [Thermoanaerobaculia bacterium]|nr:hypothetical protein [Thermoanaerobaculia bacterium]
MGYVIGLTRDDLETRLTALGFGEDVTIGNENAAQQLVLTGEPSAVARAIAALAPLALRAELLPIRHPMHSPRLAPVGEALHTVVARAGVTEPKRAALFAPMLGRRVDGAVEASEVLARQLARPSHWHAVLRGMSSEGVERFAEIGPGDVLSKMLRFTLRGARPAVVEDPETAASFAVGMAAEKTRERLSENA